MNRTNLIHAGRRWHRRLGWFGALALLVLGLSGLTHPLMTWFGPRQAVFFPPQGHFQTGDLEGMSRVLARQNIAEATLVKLLPTAVGNQLQVTEAGNPERRYFDLESGAERAGFDRRQAEWLARHYTGLEATAISKTSLQTNFDNGYPDVNRLLPVWRVTFDTPDRLTAYVHTELNALASLSNNFRTTQQALFRNLHSFSWLDGLEPVRVALLLGLCLTLILMSLAGVVLVLALPSRAIPLTRRRWHRRLALGLWLPLLAFSSSGLYHLLHHAGDTQDTTAAYPPAIDLRDWPFNQGTQILSGIFAGLGDTPLNSVTLLQGPGDQLYWRLGQPSGKPGQHVGHHGRFDGTPTEQPGRLIAVGSKAPSKLTDEELARHYAATHLNLDAAAITATHLVTAFGPDYDFRNKRLPVWRVAYQADQAGTAFIDPANGALVDRAVPTDRWEGYSFSQLHKWNFLTPLVGRQARDLLMVLVVLCLLSLGGLGVAMLKRQKRIGSGTWNPPAKQTTPIVCATSRSCIH
ncbi:MAG: hypothetical protein R6W80_05720 [Haliea sp.]